jgi:DNA-binding response OmpR family regulator
MNKIVLVEDEKELAFVIRDYLKNEGYEVIVIQDGKEALDYLMKNSIKLLILDIMLPNVDGFEICKEVRKKTNIPIIIISAKSEDDDKISGLELGADDYIVKPCSIRELSARVKAHLRRSYDIKINKEKIVDGPIIVDVQARQIYFNNNPINLANKEFDLLKILIENKDRVMIKENLFNRIWGTESFSELSTLTVHINKIREKIEKDPKKPKAIKTIWGTGYKYEGF